MSLTFYYAPMSTSTVTECVLAELGTPCERVKLDLKTDDTKQPAFRALNPNGSVPTIVHDGTAIWESAAITMYLGETFGVDAKLYPAPGPQRGEAMKWIVWANATLVSPAYRLASSEAEKAHADVTARLEVLDGALAKRDYLLGDYSLADTHVFGFVAWIGMLGVDLKRFANVSAWMQRCGGRPVIATILSGG